MINMVMSCVRKKEIRLKTIVADKCTDIHSQRARDKMATF